MTLNPGGLIIVPLELQEGQVVAMEPSKHTGGFGEIITGTVFKLKHNGIPLRQKGKSPLPVQPILKPSGTMRLSKESHFIGSPFGQNMPLEEDEVVDELLEEDDELELDEELLEEPEEELLEELDEII